jgi:hypothetical protein
MPVYSYKCGACGLGHAIHTSIAAYDPSAKPVCDECGTPMGRSYEPFPFKIVLQDDTHIYFPALVMGRPINIGTVDSMTMMSTTLEITGDVLEEDAPETP